MRPVESGGRRRDLLQCSLALGLALAAPRSARAQAPIDVVLATPGPASAVSLIPELAVKTGADRAEGIALRLKFVSGGGVAIRELNNGNASCAVFGLPAAMHENLAGPKLVALAAIEDRTLLSVMVRSDLKPVVRRIEDLRGRVLGVHSNSLTTATTGQQFLVLVLRQHQVPPESVRFVAAGQSWETQSSALRARLVDATVSEEPFGLRLEQEGLAYPLFRIGHPSDPRTLPGVGFLRGTLIAPRSRVEAQPELAQRLVRVMQRTLAWRLANPPQAVVEALGLSGADAAAIGAMLAMYPQQYSPDGRFSAAQLEQTETFFRESAGASPDAVAYRVSSMVVDRWAGRKP
ncbi:MAG: ABC transporter substrate-binding protein [Burkholderiaceae bacterium]|nr:ABC transporter substrate-binding protein [Burkholderiaceae bacterium]